uniref:ATP-dependent DNA helicase DDX11-like n=1 Tax=Styela clava TaxID=7725 RepID=UPI00193AAB2A|nr:ATP-dependent DNA helicase DDX11-like [Styela clava]
MEAPKNFPFPFIPYGIQTDFMRNLYEAIEDGKIGIFESPTGTGKSMSIICGALKWLQDNDKRIRGILEEGTAVTETNDDVPTKATDVSEEPDWITEFVQKQEQKNEEKEMRDVAKKLQSRDKKMKRILDGIQRDSFDEPSKKKMKYVKGMLKQDETLQLMEEAKRELENRDKNQTGAGDNDSVGNDTEIVLDEYYSDDENEKKIDDGEDEDSCVQKIYYCSRTHSQLTQFIREVQKSSYSQTSNDDSNFFVTVVPLASRQSLCINESVRRLSSVQQMNERCLDMQKNITKEKDEDKENKNKKKKSKSTCPFKTTSNVNDLSDKILGKVQDIEEIVKSGKEITACPYYATRQAIPLAQLIVVPYQTLLHESTRKASGIKLKDSVIIVDEAHNLVDTISNIHSIEVTCAQVLRAHNQLTQYSQKFSKRLKAKNLMYVKQILFILRKLMSVMGISQSATGILDDHKSIRGNENTSSGIQRKGQIQTTLMTIHNFLFKASLDNINLYKVLRYCGRSMISRKLKGFVEKYENSGSVLKQESSSLTKFLSNAKKVQGTEQNTTDINSDSMQPAMRSPLMHIENFLSSLTSMNADGRIALTTLKHQNGQTLNQSEVKEIASIKFLLLNPAAHFKDVVNECRSLIVAGGTMQPSSSFVNQLLAPLGVPSTKIFEFSCGHVIDKDQLLPLVVCSGTSGTQFEFTFEKRMNFKLIDELGRTLCNLCNVVPGGIVCFFPSYDYEKIVHTRWNETEILKRISLKKKIFREPKKTSQVDQILNEYSTCIMRTKSGNDKITGSLLLSVVGGKMSEGINFSDDLGRCVVMVGLPYPNLYSAELKEKMAYLDANMPRVGTKSAGQSYYENLCMKAVNQSIGRAIRHRNDHACIVLADHRYAKMNIKSQLPSWISDKLQVADRFGIAFGAVRKFFMEKKTASR